MTGLLPLDFIFLKGGERERGPLRCNLDKKLQFDCRSHHTFDHHRMNFQYWKHVCILCVKI